MFIRELKATEFKTLDIQFLDHGHSPSGRLPLLSLTATSSNTMLESPAPTRNRKHTFTTPCRRRQISPIFTASKPLPQPKTPSPKIQVDEIINLVSPIVLRPKSPLFPRTPSPKLHASEIIDLVSPVVVAPKLSAPGPIDLDNPPFKVPRGPRHLKLESSPAIDLVTPPQKGTCYLPIDLVTPPQKGPHRLKCEISPLKQLKQYKLSASPDITNQDPTFYHVCESQLFVTLDAAIIAVFDEEESLGHKWVKGQTKKTNGELRRITLRCNHYRFST